ncbi:MAG: hypothetical protein ABI377_12040 [Devosia sp.]
MSRRLITLNTTMVEFEGLHARYDQTRSTSKTVIVDREALIHLLMAHSRLVELLRQVSEVRIEDPGRRADAIREILSCPSSIRQCIRRRPKR